MAPNRPSRPCWARIAQRVLQVLVRGRQRLVRGRQRTKRPTSGARALQLTLEVHPWGTLSHDQVKQTLVFSTRANLATARSNLPAPERPGPKKTIIRRTVRTLAVRDSAAFPELYARASSPPWTLQQRLCNQCARSVGSAPPSHFISSCWTRTKTCQGRLRMRAARRVSEGTWRRPAGCRRGVAVSTGPNFQGCGDSDDE